MINNILRNIKNSFFLAWKGEEKLSNIFWLWGILSFVAIYFLIDPIIQYNRIKIIDILISCLVIIYYTWHIIVIRKCTPKKIKLSKEEKKKLKEERRKRFLKSFMKKLFLKEKITKWRPGLVVGAVDLLIITTYVEYTLKALD